MAEKAAKYLSAYKSSSGQPTNGVEYHTSKRAAIARARSLRECLICGSGGEAFAETVVANWLEEQPVCLYSWTEWAEGGRRSG